MKVEVLIRLPKDFEETNSIVASFEWFIEQELHLVAHSRFEYPATEPDNVFVVIVAEK